ncbi:zinc ribbon domain-containing protein [Desulfovermiculus halophilus]|uniref:zinc ribbon domain-containing protein n=1 Tax=Desulfovermiculus halophilus TaxID=339722 RepID=UPI00048A0002|nr:C4-type zinc ribbon domain-containing protein [Desulfovermiculus halophilus]
MSLYIKQIEELILLQRIDDEIVRLEQVIEEAPQKVAAKEQQLQLQKKQEQELQDKVAVLQEQEKKLTTEIDEDNAKIKKSKNKLMMVENSREYHAMMREMDNLEKTNRMREEEKTALEEDLETQNSMLSSIQSAVQGLEEEIQELQQNLDLQLQEAKDRLQQLQEDRKQATQNIPKPILSRYEFIRSRLSNPVIVGVEEGICTGCHISIPPQTFIELQKGEQILSCPNCQRLIFWRSHFAQEEVAAQEETG